MLEKGEAEAEEAEAEEREKDIIIRSEIKTKQYY
jgi:hypothetical protein